MITVTLLRICGDDVRCCRCRALYRQVRPVQVRPVDGPGLGTWVHCPACEAELMEGPR